MKKAAYLILFCMILMIQDIDAYYECFNFDAANLSDTSIKSFSAGSNYGTDQTINAGDYSSYHVYALINFSSIYPTLDNETEDITAAKLYLKVNTENRGTARYVYEINKSWSENSATYTSMGGSDIIGKATNGHDILLGYIGGNANQNDTFTLNATFLNEEWYKPPEERKGILISITGDSDQHLYYSSDAAAANRPILCLNYTGEDITQYLYFNTKLFNISKQFYNIDALDQEQEFYIGLNVTRDNDGTKPYNDAACNFTSQNISAVFFNRTNYNLTFDSANDQFSMIIDEGGDNLLFDGFTFEVCKINAAANVNLYVNGTIVSTVPSSAIPSCSAGYHTQSNQTAAYAGKRNFNITIKCPSCDTGHQIKLLSDHDTGNLFYGYRTFSTHTEDLVYNTTSHLQEYTEHFYTYSQAMTANLSFMCNETIYNRSFLIGEIVPEISIVQIDNTPFYNGVYVESNGTTSILINIVSHQLADISFNVTRTDGTVLKTSKDVILYLNQSVLNESGYYNISVVATDYAGSKGKINGFFLVNDTTLPAISWYTPKKDNSSAFNTNYTVTLNISINDVNLFGYEMLIYNPSNNLALNFTMVDLDTSQISIIQPVKFNVSGEWRAELTATDSHTTLEIPDYKYTTPLYDENKRAAKFKFYPKGIETNVSVLYFGQYPNTDLSLIKETDRYNFNFSFDLGSDITAKKITHKFKVECEDLYYLPKSKYTAHFVCYKARQWVDFENDNIISYSVENCGKDCFIVNMDLKPSSDVVFKSIGGLNSQRDVVTFVVSDKKETPYDINLISGNLFNNPAFNLTTTSGVLLFFFIIFVLIGLIVFGEYTQIPFIMLFAGIYWFFSGFLIYVTISAILGVILVALSVIYIVRSVIFAM